jgi:hypothetical protein
MAGRLMFLTISELVVCELIPDIVQFMLWLT